MSSQESKIAELVKNYKDTGWFTAYVGGKEFLKATTVVFHEAGADEYWIIADQPDKSWVTFAIPSSLVGDGPHVVEHPSGSLVWTAKFDEMSRPAEAGSSVEVTFFDKRTGVEGTIDFVLKDERKVTGKFNISRTSR